MAGANGPTSAAGTPDTPNPQGGVEKPEAGDSNAEPREKEQDKAGQDQNEDG